MPQLEYVQKGMCRKRYQSVVSPAWAPTPQGSVCWSRRRSSGWGRLQAGTTPATSRTHSPSAGARVILEY